MKTVEIYHNLIELKRETKLEIYETADKNYAAKSYGYDRGSDMIEYAECNSEMEHAIYDQGFIAGMERILSGMRKEISMIDDCNMVDVMLP